MKNTIPTSAEFQENLDQGEQNIILVGPSGVGKTEWQRAFSQGSFGFKGIEMDSRIGNNPKMQQFLSNFEGDDEAGKMGNAFGKPWENPQNYRKKEQQFLEAEKEEMLKLATELEQKDGGVIADLTGSAIYCREELQRVLPFGLVVYLSAGQKQYDKMQQNFLADPKPVCWDEVLDDWDKAVEQEEANEKLSELYAKLLDSRHKLYEASADIIIPWEIHRDQADINNPQTLIDAIKKELDSATKK